MPVRRRGFPSAATLAFPARTLALSGHPKPLTTLLRSAQSRVSSSRSLCKAAYGNPLRLPSECKAAPAPCSRLWARTSKSAWSLPAGCLADFARERPSLRAGARRAELGSPVSPRVTERALAVQEARIPAAQKRRCGTDLCAGGEGVLGGAPAERAHRLGAITRPNGGRSRTLPRRGHPHRPNTEMPAEARAT